MNRPARVSIARTSEADVQQRQVIVSVDDGPKATLVFGESVAWEVPPGDHVLRSNNTLVWKKTKFTAKPGEDIQFIIANRASRFTLGFLALMGVAPLYMTVERRPTPTAASAG